MSSETSTMLDNAGAASMHVRTSEELPRVNCNIWLRSLGFWTCTDHRTGGWNGQTWHTLNHSSGLYSCRCDQGSPSEQPGHCRVGVKCVKRMCWLGGIYEHYQYTT